MQENFEQLTSHGYGDSHYNHTGTNESWKVLSVAVCLTFIFAMVEVVGGYLSNSLALMSDAGHMFTDSFSLFCALAASWLSKGAASSRFSFGFAKVEVLASLLNGLLMLGVVAWIIFEAVERLSAPLPVAGGNVFIVATIGLIINIAVAWVLSKDKKNLNTRAALVHVMGDLLGSLAAIIAGGVIYFGGPVVLDPALSIFVSLLILKSTYNILRESIRELMDAVPEDISYEEVGNDMNKVSGVVSVHDLHIWGMSPQETALQAHLKIERLQDWPRILEETRKVLKEKYKITHVTLQPEGFLLDQEKKIEEEGLTQS